MLARSSWLRRAGPGRVTDSTQRPSADQREGQRRVTLTLSTVVESYAADPDAAARGIDVLPADSAAIADGLKPFAISQTARTISCTRMGKARTSWIVEKFSMRRNMTRRADTMTNAMATRPQADSHRGMSRDW